MTTSAIPLCGTAPAEVADTRDVWQIEVMAKLLEKALENLSSLPREEQDAIASQIVAELKDEAAWAKHFAAQDGETRPLDDLL